MHDVELTFARGRASEVKIKRVAYVGKTSTLATWLFNFCVKRATGRHLRDDLPARSRTGPDNAETFADVTPRESPRDGETPKGGAGRFFRLGVGSLKAPFAIQGIEVTLRSKNAVEVVKPPRSRRNSSATNDVAPASGATVKPPKPAMTRNKWRLIKGVATFIDITFLSITVRDEDEPQKDVFFCDRISMDASGSTGSLKSLISSRALRVMDGAVSATDLNIHLVANFDPDKKAVVLELAGLNGASLTLRKSSGDSSANAKTKPTKPADPPKEVEVDAVPKEIKSLLNAPRKCKLEFKRVVLESNVQAQSVRVVLADMKSSVERMSTESSGWFRKKEVVSPFAASDFAGDMWSVMKMSIANIKVMHGGLQKLAEISGMATEVTLALASRVPVGEKLPGTAAFEVEACDFRHHHNSAELLATLKTTSKKPAGEEANTPKTKKSSNPWDFMDAQATCRQSMCFRMVDEAGKTTFHAGSGSIVGQYSRQTEAADGTAVSAAEKVAKCEIAHCQIVIPGHTPVFQIESVHVSKSPSEGMSAELAGATMDMNFNSAVVIKKVMEKVASDLKASMKVMKNGEKSSIAADKESTSSPSTPLRVVLMDSSFRMRCAMESYSNYGSFPEDAPYKNGSECGFEFAVPLTEITKTNSTSAKVVTGGFTLSMHDAINQPETSEACDARNVEHFQWLGRADYESLCDETSRVMLCGGFNIDYEVGTEKRIKMNFENFDFDWEPDVHFLMMELSSLAKAAKASKDPNSIDDTTEKPKGLETIVSLDFRNFHSSILMGPGACGMISFATFQIPNVKKKVCSATDAKYGVNGYVIMTQNKITATIEPAYTATTRSVPYVEAITHETEQDIMNRRKLRFEMDTWHWILPAGLDLGDAMVAGIMGYDTFKEMKEHNVMMDKKKRISMGPNLPEPSSWELLPAEPCKELTVIANHLEMNVENSVSLDRFIRAKQAALGAAISATVFQSVTEETFKQIASLYAKHAEFLKTGGGSALRYVWKTFQYIAIYGGGRGDGDELAHNAAAQIRRVDAPFSDNTAFQCQNCLSMHMTVSHMRIQLGDAEERPIFSCGPGSSMIGKWVQARMYVPKQRAGQVPHPVGRRRYSLVSGPETPLRPSIMWYSDVHWNLVDTEMFCATALEPYFHQAAWEMINRFFLPKRHKNSPGGGGGRPPVIEYSTANPKPPMLPAWDQMRNNWRGQMRITATKSRMKCDSQGKIEHLGGHGGTAFASEIELAADHWEVMLKPKKVEMRCAHFTVSRIQDDEEMTEMGTPRASDPSPRFNLITIPVFEYEFNFCFTSVEGYDGHRTHHRHDSNTGECRIQYWNTRSVACAVGFKFGLLSKEEFLLQNVDREPDEFMTIVRNLSSMPHEFGKLTEVTFSNPTITLTPDDVAWLVKWKNGVAKPMIALRRVHRVRPYGRPRRVRHPDSKTVEKLINRIDVAMKAKTLNIVNASMDETDAARGAFIAFRNLDCSMHSEEGKEKEFAIHADSLQMHVPEHDGLPKKPTELSPQNNFKSTSIKERLNLSELDDVIKDMLLGSTALSPSDAAHEDAPTTRPTSTDPSLVLDTRRFQIVRRGDENDDNQGTQVEVEAPRMLMEATKRNAILDWIREMAAAANPSVREPTVTELERIVVSSNKFGYKDYRKERAQEDMKTLVDSSLINANSPRKPRISDDPDGQPRRKQDAKVLFVINVIAPQINFRGNDAAGRMLLAAESGLVVGRRVKEGSVPRRLVTVSLQQVQAHVAPTNVDLNAGVQWLKEKKGGSASFMVRDDVFNAEERSQSGSLLRRIFTPGAMVFEYSTVLHVANKSETNATMYAYPEPQQFIKRKTMTRALRESTSGEAMSEFTVRSPEIEAEMNSSQYAVLMDVIGSLFLTPAAPRQPRPSTQAAVLLRSRDRTLFDGDALASAAIVAKPMINLIYARWKAEAAEQSFLRACSMAPTEKRRVLDEINGYWRAAAKAEIKVLNAVTESNEFIKQYRRRSAIRLNLQIEFAAWTLIENGKPFMSAELSKLSLSRERQIDSSGVIRFKLHSLTLVTACQKNNQEIVVLSRWAPSEKHLGSKEPLVDVFVIRASSPPEEPIYDHLEMSVQPFLLNVTRQTYNRMYKYMFPEPKKSEHDSFEAPFKRVKALSAPSLELIAAAEAVEAKTSKKSLSISRKAKHLEPLAIPVTPSPGKLIKRKWKWNEVRQATDLEPILVQNRPAKGQKVVLLRHFRIHPLHMNITYEGKKTSLHDSHIALDAVSFKNFRGRWRDLTSELKSHLVWSVLKSLTGVFRGKYVESKIDDQAIIENAAKREKRRSEIEDLTAAKELQTATSAPIATSIPPNAALANVRSLDATPRAAPAPLLEKPRRLRLVKNIKKLFRMGKYAKNTRQNSRDSVLQAWSNPASAAT